MHRVLLIDDNEDFCALLKEELAVHGYEVVPTESAEDAWLLLREAEARHFDVLLVDYWLRRGGQDGLGFLEDLRRQRVQIPAILITEHGTVEAVIKASKLGVLEFITKPVLMAEQPLDELRQALHRGVEIARLMREPVRLPGENRSSGAELICDPCCGPMAEVCRLIGEAAGDPCRQRPVLIVGEIGTGKDLVARALFHHSDRWGQPFLKVPCAAFPEKALEAELFGSWGGDRPQPGVFEKANGGAVLLDDIGKTSEPIQEKILQAIDEGIVVRPGRDDKVEVDVWVITCSHGSFDSRLYYRLKRIDLPPLRKRGRRDLDLLADHFLALASADLRPCVRSFHEQARETLHAHSWKGNITELQQEIRTAVLLCHGTQITEANLRFGSPPGVEGEIITHLGRAIHAALRSGQQDLHPLLQRILARELVRLTWMATSGSPQETATRTGLPLERVQELLQDGLGITVPLDPKPGPSPPPKPPLYPSRKDAWDLYRRALEIDPALESCSDAEVFRWLKKSALASEGGLPAKSETFERYLREARAYHHGSA